MVGEGALPEGADCFLFRVSLRCFDRFFLLGPCVAHVCAFIGAPPVRALLPDASRELFIERVFDIGLVFRAAADAVGVACILVD